MAKITTFLAAASILALAACSKKTPDEFAGIDGDYIVGTPLGERFEEDANFLSESVSKGAFAPVHFGFDLSSFPASETAKINDVSTALRDAPANRLIIAGFTDERGTEEYNRGLGERRAQSVRQALIDSGISPDRIQTVSFGSELPADPRSTEEAWALNRRAEFGIVK
jgi:peptidoglycan-associated lipoprotein